MEELTKKTEEIVDLLGKITDAMTMTREKQNNIDALTEELYEEMRPMMVEKKKEEIEEKKASKEEFDEMTKNALINAKKQILQLREESENKYQEKLLNTQQRKSEIERKINRFRTRNIPKERLERLEESAQRKLDNINNEMKKYQKEHFGLREELKGFENYIWDCAVELGVEKEINAVTLEEITVPTTAPTSVPTTTARTEPTSAPTTAPTTTARTTPTTAPTTAPTTTARTTARTTPRTVPTSAPTTARTTPRTTPRTVPTSAPTTVLTTTPRTVPTSAPTTARTTVRTTPRIAPTSAPTTTPRTVPTSAPTMSRTTLRIAPTTARTAPSSAPTTAPTTARTTPRTVPTSAPTTARTAPSNKFSDIKITICPIGNSIILEAKDKDGKPVTTFDNLDYTKEFVEGSKVQEIVERVKGKIGHDLENLDKLDPNILVLLDRLGATKELTDYVETIGTDRIEESPFEITYDLKDMQKSQMMYNEEKSTVNKIAKKAGTIDGVNISKDNFLKRAWNSIKSYIGKNTRKAIVEENKAAFAYGNEERKQFLKQVRLNEKYQEYQAKKVEEKGFYGPGQVRTNEQNRNFKKMEQIAQNLDKSDEGR